MRIHLCAAACSPGKAWCAALRCGASWEGRGACRTIAGMVPTNCMTNIFQSGSFSSGISFLPHFSIAAAAEASV